MRYLLTGQQMKNADHYTIHTMGVPSLVLMERAALKVVETIKETKTDCTEVLVVCGTGNNGGDGFAIARLLHLEGHNVTILALGSLEKASEENRIQRKIAENYGIEIQDTLIEKPYTVVIDAVFGTGLTREIKGIYKEAIEKVNSLNAVKFAVDIPSGVSDTTGEIFGVAFQADHTVCLAYEKLGVCLFPGSSYAGKRHVKDIGISNESLPKEQMVYTYEKDDLLHLLPERRADSHKGTYGKVLMITGSKGMSGAAYLSAKAAYAAGAGLLMIYTHEENRIILQQQIPEAIVKTYTKFEEETMEQLMDWADVIEIGSGFSLSETSKKMFDYVIKNIKVPCVIDGDGLTLLSRQMEQLKNKKQVVLTPHMKEMTRLLHCSMQQLSENKKQMLETFVKEYPVVCALKDARTFVAENGENTYLNLTGNTAMSKAGSGDVLAGIITGFLAQKMQGKDACELGVFLHGLSGDMAKEKKGPYSVFASDLIDEIATVINKG